MKHTHIHLSRLGWSSIAALLLCGGCVDIPTGLEGDTEGAGFPGASDPFAPLDDDGDEPQGDESSGGDDSLPPNEPAMDGDDDETPSTDPLPEEESDEPVDPGGSLPGGPQFDFDCITIDRIQGPRILPPAGVQVGFRVLDCNGDPIPRMSVDMLSVINDEKGAPFGSGGEGGGYSDLGIPSEYALVSVLALDLSDSIVLGNRLDDVIDGALTYLKGIEAASPRGVDHEIAVVTFARPSAYQVVQPFTQDVATVRDALEALRDSPSQGSTDLYGSYTRAVELAEQRQAGVELVERFVVLLTDGTHEAGNEEALRQDALDVVEQTDAHVFTIGIDGAYDPTRLAELATTSENFIQVENATRLQDAFSEIAGRVDAIAGSNYVVGVCSPVALGNPSLTVRVDMDDTDGNPTGDAFTLDYPVDELDGNTAACDPNEVANARLSCQGDECNVVCEAMACGCDDGIVCGSCGEGFQCSDTFACVPGDGPGPGDATCESPAWAQGVTLLDVEVNQGAGFELARSGEALQDASQAPLVAGRDTLFRASLSTDLLFVPRRLRAELTITTAEGDEAVFVDERTVTGPIDLNDGAGALSWEVPGNLIGPGSRWSLDVLETGNAEGTDAPTRIPAAGDAPLRTTTAHTIRVELVPVRHQLNGCDRTADAAAAAASLASQLEAAIPSGDVAITISPQSYPFQQSLNSSSWVGLVSGLSSFRSSRGVDNDVFVYGVIEPCGSTGGIGGIGYVPNDPTSARSGPYRTSVGLPDPWVFVHELGHNMGRLHVACSGQEASPDPYYPHGGGRIGAWGWDPRDGAMQSPQRSDFMSYCSDRWVSDYGWTFAQSVLDGISVWADTAAIRAGSQQDAQTDGGVMAVVRPDGSSQWWTTPDAPDLAQATATVDLVFDNGDVVATPAELTWMSDDETLAIRAPLWLDGTLVGIEASTDYGLVWVDGRAIAGLSTPP